MSPSSRTSCRSVVLYIIARLSYLIHKANCFPSTTESWVNNSFSYVCNKSHSCANTTIQRGFADTISNSTSNSTESLTLFANSIKHDNIDYSYDCTIVCDGKNSCSNSTLDCGYSNQCNIFCISTNACSNSTIYGNYTNYLNWTCYVKDINTIYKGPCAPNSTIYCPIPFKFNYNYNDTSYNNFSYPQTSTDDQMFDFAINDTIVYINYKNFEIC